MKLERRRQTVIQNEIRKVMLVLLLVFALLTAASFGIVFAETELEVGKERSTAVFPVSLRILDDEAFAGTAIEIAIFGEVLQTVGDRVFADVESLTDVYFPESTKYIGMNSFCAGVLIHGAENSYAQVWAEENGFDFAIVNSQRDAAEAQRINLECLMLLLCFVIPADLQIKEKIRSYVLWFVKSLRPQDRPELYPINYRFP